MRSVVTSSRLSVRLRRTDRSNNNSDEIGNESELMKNKKQIRLLLTSSRGVINYGRFYSLKHNKDYDFYLVGVDVLGDGYKLPELDAQYKVPWGYNKQYIAAILEVVKKEKIDCIVPASDYEILVIAKNKHVFESKGVAVASSSYKSVKNSIDKASLLQYLAKKSVPVPKFFIPRSVDELKSAAKELDYPKQMLILKPGFSGGGNRGVWLVKDDFSKELLNTRSIPYISLKTLIEQLRRLKTFPNIVLMVYLPGEEYSVDALVENGQTIYALPRVRVSPLPGLSQEAQIKENDEVKSYVTQICKAFQFDGLVNVQLKYDGDKKPMVYEINPRPSATAIANTAAGVDLLAFSILKALGVPYPKDITYKPIRMIRFWKEFYTN